MSDRAAEGCACAGSAESSTHVFAVQEYGNGGGGRVPDGATAGVPAQVRGGSREGALMVRVHAACVGSNIRVTAPVMLIIRGDDMRVWELCCAAVPAADHSNAGL